MIDHYAAFKDGQRIVEGDASIDEAARLRGQADFVVIALVEPTAAEMNAVASEFKLHELAVEDAQHAHQRPKIEEYGDSIFIVLRNAVYHEREAEVELGELHLFVGADYLVIVRHGGDPHDLDEIRARVDRRPDLLAHGTSAIVYAVMDQVVDDFAPVVEEIETDIEEVETQVFSNANQGVRETTQRIYVLRRSVVQLRRATAPLILDLARIGDGGIPQFDRDVREYFRDVLDHLNRVNDQVEAFRELLTGILEANIALVSVRQNDIVRKISGWAAIIAVPTLISGVYGMNFKYMPELDARAGYPIVLGVMLLSSLGLYLLLKRIDWL